MEIGRKIMDLRKNNGGTCKRSEPQPYKEKN